MPGQPRGHGAIPNEVDGPLPRPPLEPEELPGPADKVCEHAWQRASGAHPLRPTDARLRRARGKSGPACSQSLAIPIVISTNANSSATSYRAS